MSNLEKLAYLKGLMEGLNLDQDAKETKVLNAVVELLEDVCDSIEDLDETVDTVIDEIDEIDEDLGEVERIVYEIDDDEDDCGCGHHHHHHHDDEDDDDEDWDDDEPLFEAKCPNCDEDIPLTIDMLESESINCPKCGELLEFDFDEDEDSSADGHCDCGSDCEDKD